VCRYGDRRFCRTLTARALTDRAAQGLLRDGLGCRAECARLCSHRCAIDLAQLGGDARCLQWPGAHDAGGTRTKGSACASHEKTGAFCVNGVYALDVRGLCNHVQPRDLITRPAVSRPSEGRRHEVLIMWCES